MLQAVRYPKHSDAHLNTGLCLLAEKETPGFLEVVAANKTLSALT